MDNSMDANSQFEAYRPLLFAIAYRMLGSAMEAEDMVQEAYLRYQRTPPEAVQSPKALLSTIVTRLCLNQLSSARAQRETYLGPWLPEPVLTAGEDTLRSPARHMDVYDSISLAFMVLLERLTPPERAVFLLREVFDYEYSEIAAILEKEEAACRQLFSRARKHIRAGRRRFTTSSEQHRQMLDRFIAASEAGDLAGLMDLLSEDVVFWSDGGGQVAAALYPLHGPETVAQFILGTQRFLPRGYTREITEINGAAALVLRQEGQALLVISIEVAGERITGVRVVANPDKLHKL